MTVWLRFEKQRDGRVMKMRIQDLPAERIEEATELMVKYSLRDEPVRRALEFLKNPEAVEEYRVYIDQIFRSSVNVMCCLDNDDNHPSGHDGHLFNFRRFSSLLGIAGKGTPEATKISVMYADCIKACDVVKVYSLTSYYSDKSILVLPEHRGLGIAEKFLTVRRLMCAAHGIPLTAAWMTNAATQIAAKRDGWDTIYEIPYDFFAHKYDVTFENIPPTVKLMVGRPDPDFQAIRD